MDKKKQIKIIVISLLALLLAMGTNAMLHFGEKKKAPEGAIALNIQGKESWLVPAELKLQDVTGTVVNGKGEEKNIDEKGISLHEIVGDIDFEQIEVKADDEYSALVFHDETDIAYLLVKEDTVTLVVFGDPNSKRNVKGVASIEVK